jgi:FMNH2-dependent dimethyl sulfone monooxygenase
MTMDLTREPGQIARRLGSRVRRTRGHILRGADVASGLLAATAGISVFGTVRVGLVNPVFAAKQVVTAHHIGAGRFGLNVVSGWNEGEYGMFDVPMLEHDNRYGYTEEWVTIARQIWSREAPFDFGGRYFHLKSVVSKPKPYRPPSTTTTSCTRTATGKVPSTSSPSARRAAAPSRRSGCSR